MKRPFLPAAWIATAALAGSMLLQAQESNLVALPKPQLDRGRPLMQVLKDRQSTRSFSAEKLSPQTLANLLWAADGVNRPESGHRTAPSAMNWQEIDVYVATADGLFLYDAKNHNLRAIASEDVRAKTGLQQFVKEAPLNLVYVADYSRMTQASAEDKLMYSSAGAGFVSENVYLYCASEGLVTVVRAMIDRPELAKAMKLRPDQKIILAQTVGYPKK